jgi:hypothetical protein
MEPDTNPAPCSQMAHRVLPDATEANMQLLVLSATLAGSLGVAWVIQRAILEFCFRVIDPNRR